MIGSLEDDTIDGGGMPQKSNLGIGISVLPSGLNTTIGPELPFVAALISAVTQSFDDEVKDGPKLVFELGEIFDWQSTGAALLSDEGLDLW